VVVVDGDGLVVVEEVEVDGDGLVVVEEVEVDGDGLVVVEEVEVDGDGLVVVEDSVILFLSSLFLFSLLLFAPLIPSIFRVDFLSPDSLDVFALASFLSLILKLEYLIHDFIYYLLDHVNKKLHGQLEFRLATKNKD
ncbi:MAG TPA: hypothetical protein VLE21_02140, partial [Candidatus Nitrosocosmicus sp.]|nr:hypothetical protein [Candidatus Nitrosocosmicus sp.]